MTLSELRAKFPNASSSFLKKNGGVIQDMRTPYIDWPLLPGEKRKPAPKRIRQSTKPLLNRLETEWHQQLKAQEEPGVVWCQAVRFRLGNGLSYTPDFVSYNSFTGQIKAWECKGNHVWDDAIAKLKMAATTYPEITWYLVWKDRDGQWQKQQVLP